MGAGARGTSGGRLYYRYWPLLASGRSMSRIQMFIYFHPIRSYLGKIIFIFNKDLTSGHLVTIQQVKFRANTLRTKLNKLNIHGAPLLKKNLKSLFAQESKQTEYIFKSKTPI